MYCTGKRRQKLLYKVEGGGSRKKGEDEERERERE